MLLIYYLVRLEQSIANPASYIIGKILNEETKWKFPDAIDDIKNKIQQGIDKI